MQEQIIECKYCGGYIPDEDLRCPHCGAPITSAQAAVREQNRRQREAEQRERERAQNTPPPTITGAVGSVFQSIANTVKTATNSACEHITQADAQRRAAAETRRREAEERRLRAAQCAAEAAQENSVAQSKHKKRKTANVFGVIFTLLAAAIIAVVVVSVVQKNNYHNPHYLYEKYIQIEYNMDEDELLDLLGGANSFYSVESENKKVQKYLLGEATLTVTFRYDILFEKEISVNGYRFVGNDIEEDKLKLVMEDRYYSYDDEDWDEVWYNALIC